MPRHKTPSSLHWLIRKKAKLSGEISNIEKTLPTSLAYSQLNLETAERKFIELRENHNKNLSLGHKLPKLKSQLEAIEIALTLHEVQINTDLIRPVGISKKKAYGPYGSVTRNIYECLRLHRKATTREITLFVMANNELDKDKIDFEDMRVAIRKRLRTLVHQGKVERLHKPLGSAEGIWKIPSAV